MAAKESWISCNVGKSMKSVRLKCEGSRSMRMESSSIIGQGVGVGEGPVPYFRWAAKRGKDGSICEVTSAADWKWANWWVRTWCPIVAEGISPRAVELQEGARDG